MIQDFKNLFSAIVIIVKKILAYVKKSILFVYNFLRPVENTIKGQINPEEFYRVIMTALSSGGGFYGFLEYIQGHYQEFIVDPNLASGVHAFIYHCQSKHLPWAIFTAVFILEYIRRKYSHGDQS